MWRHLQYLFPQSGKDFLLEQCFSQGIQRSLLSWQYCILYSYGIVVWLLVSYWNISYNIRHKSLKRKPFLLNFLQISYFHFSYLCSHSNVPLSFPNVELRVFWSTETTVIPKSTLGKGKSHKCFKICDEYCSSLTYWLDWLANVLRFILRKGINLMHSWCESRLLQLLMKMTDFSFQIRFVQQMCQDFNSQDFELILSTVSAV